MSDFLSFLSEATSSGYNDEHAFTHLWNHVVSSPEARQHFAHDNADTIRLEIEKAKDDITHPLNAHNAPKEGFTNGKRDHEAYYKELHHVADAVHAVANHPSFQAAVKKKMKARAVGGDRGVLTDVWKKNGSKPNTAAATSKSDVIIGDHTTDDHHSISLKKGKAQLMSAEPEEMLATYDHATNEHMKTNRHFKHEDKEHVMGAIRAVAEHMHATKNKSKAKQIGMLKEAQAVIDAVHEAHPGLLKHIHHEAATGHGKFGYGQKGTARHIVTIRENSSHVHDTLTNHEPIIAGKVRLALPKYEGRPANAKVEYKTIKVN